MKNNKRNVLLLLSSLLAGFTTFAAIGVMQSVETQADVAETGFAMVGGASLRADSATADSTGLRFKVNFDSAHYDKITETDAKLYVAIIPYTYYQNWQSAGGEATALDTWLDETYGVGKTLNLEIPDEKIYQVSESVYGANAVMNNVRLQNYHRDFIGVAYIQDGEAYEYAELDVETNVRNVVYIADKAYRDEEDYENYGEFLTTTLYKGIYSAYGVKYNSQTGKYTYDGVEYAYDDLEIEVLDPSSDISLEVPDANMYVGGTYQLKPSMIFANDNTSYKETIYGEWKSSNEEVATVDENGVLTAHKEGTAEITLMAFGELIDDYGTITVSAKPTVVVSEDVMFMAQGNAGKWAYNTGAATIDLTGVEFDVSDIQKVICNGQEIAFSVSGNSVTLTDAPGGDQLYTFETSNAKYVIGGCIYGLGISTVEELEAWRTSESYWYAVLLNDIDYEGATLTDGANVLGVLDGRGYKISNFTTANGFINRLYAAESVIKNVYFTGVTQDCSAWTGGIDRGVLGQWNNGTLENVYLQVHTTNVVKEHYGVLCYGMNTGSKIANVVVEVTSDSTLFHYVMMHDYALAEGNSVGVVGSYANGTTESAESAWGTNSGFHQQLSWMIAEEANDELLTFTSPYWIIDATARTITMKPRATGVLVKTVVEVEDVLFAQGNAGKWSYDTGAATLTIDGADLSTVESVTIDGEAFTNYTASGSTITLTNAAGGDHAVIIETATHVYKATVCVYVLGISTVEELEAWRTSESYWYAVLLNDIDYEGATLTDGANVLGVLDGRGYKISNFTTANGFINRLYAAESVIKNVYFTGVTQDCSAWTGGIDRGVLGQWNNGTLENVYLQVHTTNVVKEHYGVLCFGMDTGSKIANVVVEVTSDSTLFHYVMMTDNALADGNSVGVVGSYANGATESAESAWGVNSGFHQQLSWMVAEEANDELLTFTSPYWTIDATARTITMNPVKFTFETEEETPVGPEQPEIITEQVKVNETYYNEAGSLDLTGSGIDVSAITEITSGGTAVSFTANGNILTVAAGTSGAESEYVITTPAVIYTVTVLACDNAITTADEFTAWVAAPSGYVVLANDIDLKGATVGAETNMAGTFNGQGYAIYNLTTTGTTGVFKYVGGTFKNVQFINYTQDCENVAATRGLFGDNVWGTIENLLIQGQIINNSAGHNGIIVKYTSSGTFKNIVAYMESSATDKYHYGLTSGGDGTPTASNVYFVSSNSLGVAFNYDNSLGTVENCASYATEAAMLAAVDFSTWETPWTVNENGAPRMREISVPTILLSDVNAQIYDGKASLTLSALGISSSAVTKVTVGGANLWYEISNDALTINAAKSGTYKVVIYTVWSAYQVKVYCYNLEPVLLSGSVLAQSVDGQASVDLSAYDLQGAKIVGVTCGGVSIDFTHESNALTLVNAPYGDQTYELLTDGQYKYILDCCVYENGISTADQLNTWRNAGMTGYSVLLNDIDYNGATLTEGGYVIDATLDGRGYKITNFTYKNFVTRLYNNNAVVKNVYFDSITQDCSSWTGGIDQGLFGNWHSGVIENVYVNVTTTNMSGEHYATLFYGTEAGAVVRNVVVEIESTVDKFHYVYMKNEGAGAVVEGVVGSYGNSTGSTEGGNEAWGVNSGFHQQLSWMIAEEANDELLSFTSPYWVIDTAARTIELLPLAETKPAVVEDGYLVKESESAYAIVIDANNTSNAIRKAVTELQTLFKEATGVQLRCVTDSNATYASNVKYISLGYNNYTSDAGVSLGLNEEIGSQGYKIVTVEQSIIILGEPQGVLYGVYQLMHELFGFEQYTKDVYTLNGATTVALPDLKIVDAPDVEHRVAFSGVQLNDETSRNRMRTQHSGEIIMNNGNAHNMTRYIVPFDTYYSTNPTWYSSMTDSSDTYGTTQLCYTAGEYGSDNYNAMKAVAVASIKEIILANPQADMMSLTQMDVEGMWCSCSGCQAIISQYGEESATQILFVNDVVSEIETWLNNEQGGREVKFMMFAYYETQEAPTGLTLNENVSVWIAPIKDNYTTGVNASGNSMGSMLSDWKNVASSVAIWAYGVYFSEYLVPYNTFDYIDQLVDACVASNAEYMWIQGNWNTTQNTGFDSLKAYLISKLMWDSTLDVNTLTDNYFNAVYGAAADKMKEVYTEMKTELASMSLSGNIYDAPCGFSEWDNSYLTAQLDRLVAAIGMLDSNAADYQTIYDAIVCESISFRYIYKENSLLGLGGNYSTDAWGTFEEDVARLGFTMVSEQKTMEAYLA